MGKKVEFILYLKFESFFEKKINHIGFLKWKVIRICHDGKGTFHAHVCKTEVQTTRQFPSPS